MPENPKKTEVAVIGAGLVGSLLSLYLARKGKKVALFERRSDMRRESISAGRSINLAISTRGIHALKELGLDQEILARAVPMKGRMIHPPKGDLVFQRYGKDDSECINSISRGELNKSLMTAAEATGRVSIYFDQRVTLCDPKTKTFEIEDEKSHSVSQVSTDVLIGTDGSASAIRAEIVKQPGAECTESYLDYAYKELHIDPGPSGSFKMEKNALHIWPRGTFMLIALPNFDGSYTVTLFLPMEGEKSFAALNTPERVEEFFEEQFPDALPLISNLREVFFSNSTGRMVTVKCAPWNLGDWAVLLGDAAHAIVPFFGQGMNCGFEDCTIFAEIMDARGSDWTRFFGEFGRDRKPDSDAIADLAVENFREMRDKVGNVKFLLEKEVEKILEKEFPGEYLSRYRLVTFHRVPYRVALQIGVIQDKLLNELCEGLTRADQVDLTRARKLIQERMAPLSPAWREFAKK